MTPTYKIHPAIGIARLGNSSEFYLAPEKAGGLPIQCNPDGTVTQPEEPVTAFKDNAGAIKRQAARFRVFIYDDASPDGRELKLNDTIKILNQTSGQIMTGTLTDVIWTVYLANKKASWYEFDQTAGEHGYAPDAVLRNQDITDPDLRQNLIIDPGPQSVAIQAASGAPATAQFSQGQNLNQTFPPPLVPNSITTLGEIMATKQGDHARLVVLGGNGNSGSSKKGLGEPHIQAFANNDGWFDDVSDGPVTAQLLVTVTEIDGRPLNPGDTTFTAASVNVDDPAWVIVAYPRYAPELVDVVTLDDVIYDLSVRNFAFNTYMYGVPPFKLDAPPHSQEIWQKEAKWNPNYYPYFWQEVWPILTRPYYYQFVMDFDPLTGGDPHETARGSSGNMDPDFISIPPFDDEDPTEREIRYQRRIFIYHMLRKPGGENQLTTAMSKLDSNQHPFAMPYLCGDNPLSNTSPSKFLRLTETQLFILRQWAEGKFINEKIEKLPPRPVPPGEELDRGTLGCALGGAFCPGGEVCWIVRDPAIYSSPYRINQASPTPGGLSQPAVVAGGTAADLAAGLEPGDITKYDAVPWQSDFNECSNQPIDITYENWCEIYPDSTGDPVQPVTQLTYWWPVHRPMEVTTYLGGANYTFGPWSPTAQTHVGDLQMVTAWATLGFILRNPTATPGSNNAEFVNVPSGNMNAWKPNGGTQ